jgi:glc operon protein GlcG
MVYRKSITRALFVAVLVLFSLGCLEAQAPAKAPGPATPVQGGPGDRQPSAPQLLDLATARKMVAAVQAAAVAKNQRVAVCIMDARGDMVAFERMDVVNIPPVTTAIGKAHTALAFGVPTGQIVDAMQAGKPLPVMFKAPLAGQDNLTFLRGGLPIMKDGKMIGAIGVGGSSSEEDEQIAQAGIDAVMGK